MSDSLLDNTVTEEVVQQEELKVEPTVEEQPTETDTEQSDNLLDNTPVDERPEWLAPEFETVEDFLNKHTAPDAYEINLPEGTQFSFPEELESGMTHFQEMAKGLGINQAGFDQMVEFYIKSETEKQARDWSVRQTAFNEAHGKTAQTTLSRVNAVLGETGGTALRDALSNSVTSQKSAMDVISSLLQKLDGEYKPSMKQTTAQSLSPDTLREMMSDPRYKTSEEYREQVRKAYDSYYG